MKVVSDDLVIAEGYRLGIGRTDGRQNSARSPATGIDRLDATDNVAGR